MDSLHNQTFRLEELMPLIREELAAGRPVTFSPRGTSMLPMLRQELDSVTLASLPEKLQKYDLPLYRRDNGQYVLHRIIRAGDTYTCIGDNQFAEESGVRRDQMIALVTSFRRGNREYSVQDPAYRLYCRIWHLSRPVRYPVRRMLSLVKRILS